jgi:tRNA pseudouridine55 synthase
MITKDTNDFNSLDFYAGQIILIDKPAGWSSFKVVRQIRNAVNVKKVGHAGTLDPLATGLLILATGKKTKEIHKYQGMEKTYTGTIMLGKVSSSMDTETEVTSEKSVDNLSEEKIHLTRNKFLGKITQIPPMYSAVKYKGKNLYKYARQGKDVNRQPRQVVVYEFKIKSINLPEVKFEITCSKGTYIRVIANDFGDELGCGGLLSSLRREKIGAYSVDDALSCNQFVHKCIYLKELQRES